MNTSELKSNHGVSVASFESMGQVRAAYPFVGSLTPADVAIVPMNPPKMAERLGRAPEPNKPAPSRAPRF